MARGVLSYGDRRDCIAPVVGFDPDVPTAGFYRLRLRKGAIPVGVHVFYGQTLDPETGEPLERWAWQATVNGQRTPITDVWPQCAADPIDEAEHDYLIETEKWGRQTDPSGPFADRRKPVDLITAPLPW
jgi:hypothetical protein